MRGELPCQPVAVVHTSHFLAKQFCSEGLSWPSLRAQGEWVSFSLGNGSSALGLYPWNSLAGDAGVGKWPTAPEIRPSLPNSEVGRARSGSTIPAP